MTIIFRDVPLDDMMLVAMSAIKYLMKMPDRKDSIFRSGETRLFVRRTKSGFSVRCLK